MASILFGLASALSWGAGDFSGALASRWVGAYRAALYGELAGLFLLVAAIPFVHEAPLDGASIFWCSAAGAVGALGLLILYHGMAIGKMSLVAPISAVLAAMLPVVVGLLTDGLPGAPQLAGFGFALVAVWLVSQEGTKFGQVSFKDPALRLAVESGVCFGLYFVFVHLGSRYDLLWPMIASRGTGVLALVIFMLAGRQSARFGFSSAWLLIAVNGTLDVGGNLFYILAGQAGRLDMAAVLSSLYPGGTVILAWLILKERVGWVQKLGILAALTAILLMTL